jgi:opacity protein-like surface antigen
MFNRMVATATAVLLLCTVASTASAAEWSAEQQEIWKVEQQQWKMSATKDTSWIDTMVHPNMTFWETGAPMPRDKASLKHWSRYDAENGSTLEQELFPISATITGNVAVVQYNYMVARENYKKERETVTGHYTDVLVKDGGRWLFLTWMGGDDPKK